MCCGRRPQLFEITEMATLVSPNCITVGQDAFYNLTSGQSKSLEVDSKALIISMHIRWFILNFLRQGCKYLNPTI